MTMAGIRIFMILICCSFFAGMTAQERLVAIRSDRSQGFTFYDYDGKVRFSLPPDHDPAVRPKIEPHYLENFYVIDFKNNALPVRFNQGFYVVNQNGKTTKELASGYKFVSSMQNGYFRAHKLLPDNNTLIEYYDYLGNRAFGDADYFEGGIVINEVALVRLYQLGVPGHEQAGDWVLVNHHGDVLKNISQQAEGKLVRFYEDYNHQWNLTMEGVKYKSNLYILPDGSMNHLSFENKSPERQELNRYYDIADSIARRNNLPMKTRWVWPTAVVNNEVFYLGESGEGRGILYDQFQKEIKLEKNGNTIIPRYFIEHYVVCYETNGGQYISTPVFDLSDKRLVTTFNHDPHKRDGDLFIYYTHDDLYSTVEKVVTIQGKTIYQLDISNRYVTDMDEIKSNRDKVKLVLLRGKTLAELESLGPLKNVEIVKIEKYQGDHLPDNLFLGWNKVKTLKISMSKNLKALPSSMKSLKNLTNVTVMAGDHLIEFTSWFENWPMLKKVKTNLPVSDEVQKKYPNIIFEKTLLEIKGE